MIEPRALYCQTCRAPTEAAVPRGGGVVVYRHVPSWGEQSHPLVAVPLEELDGPPLSRCDVCSSVPAVWAYECAQAEVTGFHRVKGQTVNLSDYRSQHRAARATRTLTELGSTYDWDSGWAFCEPCAELVEARDALGMVSRAVDAVGWRLSGKKLIQTRGRLLGFYERFFETLLPGREPMASS